MNTVRTEKRERTVTGKFIKWSFIAFNILMLVWMFSGIASVSKIETHSSAEHIGAAIGASIGISILLTLWALGDLILGALVLLTRGNKTIIETSSVSPEKFASSSTSSLDFTSVDQRIAQLKSDQARSVSRATPPSSGPVSFGKRHA
jgi:hypothetical protein